jgi:uncharacterized protein YjbJ (UPF0337 family)
MNINKNIIEGKWLEIKGDIQKTWGKLTENELEQAKGDVKALSGLIQQKYGETQEKSSKKITEIFDRFSKAKSEKVEEVKNKLRK